MTNPQQAKPRLIKCIKCNGEGYYLVETTYHGERNQISRERCQECDGLGQVKIVITIVISKTIELEPDSELCEALVEKLQQNDDTSPADADTVYDAIAAMIEDGEWTQLLGNCLIDEISLNDCTIVVPPEVKIEWSSDGDVAIGTHSGESTDGNP